MKSMFEEMGGTYSVVGDYLLPDLVLPEQQDFLIGRYGMCRKVFLKDFRRAYYNNLLLSGRLNEHLHEIDLISRERLEVIMLQMKNSEGVTEQLKADNQLAWVGAMNSIKARAEEIIFEEIIYE